MEKRLAIIQLQKDLISTLYTQIDDLKEDNNCVKAENRILRDKITKLEKLILSLDSIEPIEDKKERKYALKEPILFYDYL